MAEVRGGNTQVPENTIEHLLPAIPEALPFTGLFEGMS